MPISRTDTTTSLVATGLIAGTYFLYSADAAGNLSAPHANAVIVDDGTAPNITISDVSGADQAGYSVSNAGDVNGDGLDDSIVAALYDDPNGANSGSVFVVYGQTGTTAVALSGMAAEQLVAGAGNDTLNGQVALMFWWVAVAMICW